MAQEKNHTKLEKLIYNKIKKLIEKQGKLTKDKLQKLAKALLVNWFKTDHTGRKREYTKTELCQKLLKHIENVNIKTLINAVKNVNIGFSVEVKELIDHNINPISILDIGICAKMDNLKEKFPNIIEMFDKTCELFIRNNKVVSNCKTRKVQGLYILVIEHNNEEYIVKLGSFAETQGMSKRIQSFGGGCYETGSRTNQWFQKFIRSTLESDLKCRFYYYEKIQDYISITSLKGKIIRMVPYIIRPLETELFEIYAECNNYIPPLFGSNCTDTTDCLESCS